MSLDELCLVTFVLLQICSFLADYNDSLENFAGTQADHGNQEYGCVCVCVQGDALRNELLSRYYGRLPGYTKKAAAAKSSSHGGAHTAVAETDRGSLILSRAQMTLHDVQVRHLSV